MHVHPLAGRHAPEDALVDIAKLESTYAESEPELSDPTRLVAFGTSGHRGRPDEGTFLEPHVLAIAQAICDYRREQGRSGPVLIGKDTHALSILAERTVVEVLAANGVEVWVQEGDGYTPTPSISRAILRLNRQLGENGCDGILLTPSHNPPQDGGIKYNPPNGGPADTDVTNWIERRANELLRSGTKTIKRLSYEAALRAPTTRQVDFISPYVEELGAVLDMDAIRSAGLKFGVDPLGGASHAYWAPIAERFGLDLTVVNPRLDKTFRFVPVDHDGQIRMDCSSAYAMAGLVTLRDRFDVAWASDPDADRHGIVTKSAGLLNPNHYLAAAVWYLLQHRPQWRRPARVGKTLVSSAMIDRVVEHLGAEVWEVPVGFKWFSQALFDGTCCFGGEESAGASFLTRDGSVWTTDKDGLLLGLLAAEMTAVTGRDPGEHYEELAGRFGTAYYRRIDAPATPVQKAALKSLSPSAITQQELAGEPITAVLTSAPGNGASIGGLKVMTASGWFAARPSGTENVYKLYAESLKSAEHLEQILGDAQRVVSKALS
jgi:phosphoglucomutase